MLCLPLTLCQQDHVYQRALLSPGIYAMDSKLLRNTDETGNSLTCNCCRDMLEPRAAALEVSDHFKNLAAVTVAVERQSKAPLPQWAHEAQQDRASWEGDPLRYAFSPGIRYLEEFQHQSQNGCQSCTIISMSVARYLELHKPSFLGLPKLQIKALSTLFSGTTLALCVTPSPPYQGTARTLYLEIYTYQGKPPTLNVMHK
jgi:hypothetical protein